MPTRIAVARTDDDILACHPVMAELRPHLAAGGFVALTRRLEAASGFRLAFADDGGVKAVAGYRVGEWLAGGRYLEIEDLVTADGSRSKGYGGELFDWLVREAAADGCRQVRLVSHVRRADAHRFYRRKGMTAEAHYFSLTLPASVG